MSEQLAEDSGCKLVTFGSYRLGVHNPGSDIDTLCIVPQHITKEHFFRDLYQRLKENELVKHLTAVPDAYVPLMKMEVGGISIDMLFAQLKTSMIPENFNILSEENLNGVDDETQRSLNGPRVADQILNLVPNADNFKMTLRCIKLWAQRRGIYGNAIGYLGGVSWAILTVRICQLYPNALPNVLLFKFFKLYSIWEWPHPILLKTIITDGTLSGKVWNPNMNIRDKQHLMPIITPSYPSMNSTYNVSRSTLKIMQQEFERGLEVTTKCDLVNAGWEELFEETDFFIRYRDYIEIEIGGQTEHDLKIWYVSYPLGSFPHNFSNHFERFGQLYSLILYVMHSHCCLPGWLSFILSDYLVVVATLLILSISISLCLQRHLLLK